MSKNNFFKSNSRLILVLLVGLGLVTLFNLGSNNAATTNQKTTDITNTAPAPVTTQIDWNKLTPEQSKQLALNNLDTRDARIVVVKSVNESIISYKQKHYRLPKSVSDIKNYCEQYYSKIPIKNYEILKDYTSDPSYVTCTNPSTLGLKILDSFEEYNLKLDNSAADEFNKKQTNSSYKYSAAFTVFLNYGAKCLAPQYLKTDGLYDTRYSTKSDMSSDYTITMAHAYGTICVDNYYK
jgi:hypothetical protein